MREMKESGVEWVGKIPNNWKAIKLFYCTNTITDYTANGSFADLAKNVEYVDFEDYAILVRTADLSKKRTLLPVYISEKSYNYLKYSYLIGGELILSNIGSVGDVYLYKPIYKHASLAPNALLIRSLHNKYFYYLFSNNAGKEALNRLSSSTTQAKFNKTQLRNFKVILPPGNEEEKIISFLDKKCAEIEDLTADIQTQIETLEEYKKSVITEAVTKGLDPNAEMKDSGVDFIGYMPSHWKTLRIKYIGTYFNGLTYSPQDICEPSEGTLVLRSSNIKNSKLDLNDCVYVSRNINSSKMVKPEDILICSRNGSRELVGKSAYITDIKASFGAFMMILRPCALVKSKYIFYILNSGVFSYYLASFFTSTINQLTANNFGNMKIPFVGSLDEQHQIADFLDQKCSEIDQTISEKQQQLDTLAEYKKSLIYEYVTGKKEVA